MIPISTTQETVGSLLRDLQNGHAATVPDTWILQNEGDTSEAFESKKLRETASECGLNIKTHSVDDFQLVSNHQNSLFLCGKRVAPPAIVLARTGAETSPLGFSVLHHLESLGSRVVNSTASIADSRCKFRSAQMLSAAGLPIPTTISLREKVDPQFIARQLGTPLVVKYAASTRGEGVAICRNANALEEMLQMIANMGQRPPMIAQQYVAESCGRDLRVIVIGGKVIGCMERQSQTNTWKANISLGGRLSLYGNVTPEIERLAVDAAQVLGLEIAGVDLLFGGEGPILCEVNSAPDFEGVHEASAGSVDVASSIVSYCGDILSKLQ